MPRFAIVNVVTKANKKSPSIKYLAPVLAAVAIISIALNVWLISQNNNGTASTSEHRSNEQIVRDMLIYEASYAGLTLEQAKEKAEKDNLLPKIGSRDGEPVPQLSIRITPVGSVVAYFDLVGRNGNETVQGVDFWGEVSHFEYLDILRSEGQSAANGYAKRHNLH